MNFHELLSNTLSEFFYVVGRPTGTEIRKKVKASITSNATDMNYRHTVHELTLSKSQAYTVYILHIKHCRRKLFV